MEIRKDYIIDRWSYIAKSRSKRPKEFEKNNAGKNNRKKRDIVCYFCPGNENLTPPEIGRIEDDKGWKIRWFPNKFPIIDDKTDNYENSSDLTARTVKEKDAYHISKKSFGYHEIIVETPDHNKQFECFDESDIKKVFEVYSLRIKEISKRKNISYVQVFKNRGKDAGASIIHSHSQIVASNTIPKSIVEKVNSVKKFKKCPYCSIIPIEEKSNRFIFGNKDFVAFASYAPRFCYEVCVLPRTHFRSITEFDKNVFENLSEAFKVILSKLGKLNIPYNFYIQYSPKKNEDLHLHFEIAPRINVLAGFELATNSYAITISPEEAAEFYREK